jgi:hypothetical protein
MLADSWIVNISSCSASMVSTFRDTLSIDSAGDSSRHSVRQIIRDVQRNLPISPENYYEARFLKERFP